MSTPNHIKKKVKSPFRVLKTPCNPRDFFFLNNNTLSSTVCLETIPKQTTELIRKKKDQHPQTIQSTSSFWGVGRQNWTFFRYSFLKKKIDLLENSFWCLRGISSLEEPPIELEGSFNHIRCKVTTTVK